VLAFGSPQLGAGGAAVVGGVAGAAGPPGAGLADGVLFVLVQATANAAVSVTATTSRGVLTGIR
jgi:hypothetical protein